MINTVTLNPAIDKMLYLNNFKKNTTNRIQNIETTIGGKGTHVSINLKQMNENSNAFGICHGETGTKIIEMLQSSGINVHFIHEDEFQSRTNYLLVEESGDCTIVAEKGVLLAPKSLERLIADMGHTIQNQDFLVLSGDASNCEDPMIYNKLLSGLRAKNLKVFLDTSGETLPLCIKESPFLIKPNLDELSALCGHPVAPNDRDIIAAIHSLAPYHIQIIAVSLGEGGSIIQAPGGIYRAYPPKVRVANTIGCGDCFLAGFVSGVSRGEPIEEIIRWATAVSAATAESRSSVGFRPERARELASLVKIIKLD